MDSVGYYISHFIVITITFLYIIIILHCVSNYKIKNKAFSFFIILVFIVINYFLEITNVLIIKNIFIIIGLVVFIKMTSNLSIKDSVKAFIRMFLIIMVSEIISGFILCYVFKLSNPTGYYLVLTKAYSLINVIITLNLAMILRRVIRWFAIKEVSWVFIVSIIFLLITIGTLNYVSTYNSLHNAYTLFIVLLVFIIFGVLVIVSLLKTDYNKKLEINNLKNKNSEVIKYINSFKTYKHNLKYNLIAIKEYGNPGVNIHIDELLNSNNTELEYMDNFKEIPSNLIHVFSNCLTITNDNNISIIIKNSYKDKELIINMSDYLQLNEIIGNCLTNAIEAIPDSGGFIYVYFYEEENNQFIKIINNFINDIDFDRLGQINYSTKNRSSGFGLNSIFNRKNIKVTGKVTNDLFEMKIMIPK